ARKPFSLFQRDGQKVKASAAFGLGSQYPYIDRVLRPNASLISTLAQLQHPYSLKLKGLASLVSSNIGIVKWETTDEAMIPYYTQDQRLAEFFNREVGRLDIGITRFSIADMPNGQKVAQFEHSGLASPIASYFESHGTRQFFRVFPFIGHALMNGGIAIVDELDTSIHPSLLAEIVGWFFNPSKNPHGAQLWMTAQSPSLLEDLLKEEIFFCEKDALGRTSIFGLRHISGVRRIDNYYRKYLGGVYGAVPHVG
ncbi:MAG: AAA family ATPase, partial [Vulcanimicrobiaceae bacterium]